MNDSPENPFRSDARASTLSHYEIILVDLFEGIESYLSYGTKPKHNTNYVFRI